MLWVSMFQCRNEELISLVYSNQREIERAEWRKREEKETE